MILLDAPYVSDFLKTSIVTLHEPVLDTPAARSFLTDHAALFCDPSELSQRIHAGERIYSNSENTLDQIISAATDSDLARQINICKDKVLFRETIAPLHPEYQFMRVDPERLDELEINDLPTPFVIKPARGFFSLGVHMVLNEAAWPGVIKAIRQELAKLNAEYPESVVDCGEFIIEAAIDGEEYAIDVYYDGNGDPVITNILYHQFASEDDVSDRLYYTSAEIMEAKLPSFTDMVGEIGRACDFRSFPIHLEVRVCADGTIVPIEANPLRFAGWCVTDITTHAWDFNPYEYYLRDLRPDWPAILEQRQGMVYAMIIGDVPPQIDRSTITRVDYDGFCDQFETVMELRTFDYASYPLFAMAFTKTDEKNLDSLKAILSADFSRFIEAAS